MFLFFESPCLLRWIQFYLGVLDITLNTDRWYDALLFTDCQSTDCQYVLLVTNRRYADRRPVFLIADGPC